LPPRKRKKETTSIAICVKERKRTRKGKETFIALQPRKKSRASLASHRKPKKKRVEEPSNLISVKRKEGGDHLTSSAMQKGKASGEGGREMTS